MKNRRVYVLGAGASRGEELVQDDIAVNVPGLPYPPLIRDFFNGSFLKIDSAVYKDIKKEYGKLIEYISRKWAMTEEFGTGRWECIDLEQVFTSLAIEHEFYPQGSDENARCQLRLNKLTSYIRRILKSSTGDKTGKYTSQIVTQLRDDDSIITFNYDLLIDKAFFASKSKHNQYENFLGKIHLTTPIDVTASLWPNKDGLFLKLHGSLNWYRCPNATCRLSSELHVSRNIHNMLGDHLMDYPSYCSYCGSELNPFLIPPLLNKPIATDGIIRSIWGNAFSAISSASELVIVGYSFPATDFYAQWLFRSAMERNREFSKMRKKDCRVWIVNPDNGDTFKQRMESIFFTGYDARFNEFSEIAGVLAAL